MDQDRSALALGHHFPLVEWNEDEGRFDALHHPFTNLVPEDVATLRGIVAGGVEKAPREAVAGLRAQAYDLVLDGVEVAGGSIRIHRQDVQSDVFRLIALDPAERPSSASAGSCGRSRYGTPPHGGHRLRLRPAGDAPAGRDLDPRGDRLPEDDPGRLPDERGARGVDRAQLDELGLALDTRGAREERGVNPRHRPETSRRTGLASGKLLGFLRRTRNATMSSAISSSASPTVPTRQVAAGTTVREVARDIGPRLAKAAVAGVLDGDVVEVERPLRTRRARSAS